jgi:hypothetical protein
MRFKGLAVSVLAVAVLAAAAAACGGGDEEAEVTGAEGADLRDRGGLPDIRASLHSDRGVRTQPHASCRLCRLP